MKYTFDTNIFIDGFRSEEAQAEVFAFLHHALPFTYLSAVVVQELAAGARSVKAARLLQIDIVKPFERRGRVFAPSIRAFSESGRLLSELGTREGRKFLNAKPSFVNDALIAASCREQGVTLITKDTDFKRLSALIRGFKYSAPWPPLTRRAT